MKQEHAIEQLIITHLKNDYNIEVTNIIPLSLGADVNASLYKAQTADQTYFVKLKRGKQDTSTQLQLLLHEVGIKEVIAPVKTVEGQPQVHLNDFTLTVYPFIDGHDGFSKNLTNNQWATLGKALKRIHQFELPTSILPLIKQENFSPLWQEKVRSIYEDIKNITPLDEIGSKFLESLKQHESGITSLIDKAEKLSQIVQKKSGNFVLCHGDIHAGNVFIATDGTLYIVDWDQPIMAPEEKDLMFIGAGVGNVWNSKQEAELFYSGYGTTQIDHNLINYYRYDRILQDVAEYYKQLSTENTEYKNQEVAYNHFIAMFEPNGVVDIALHNKN